MVSSEIKHPVMYWLRAILEARLFSLQYVLVLNSVDPGTNKLLNSISYLTQSYSSRQILQCFYSTIDWRHSIIIHSLSYGLFVLIEGICQHYPHSGS